MASLNSVPSIEEMISAYNIIVSGIGEEAVQFEGRAYGGVVRSAKGILVEALAPNIVKTAWQNVGGTPERLSIGKSRSYRVHIRPVYISNLEPDVRDYINSNIANYYFNAHVDRHIFVDENFVMGVECKSYAENAMMKRILVDYQLLKTLHPELICCLLQLESMLTGDYSKLTAVPQFGSPSTHTLMSHFPEVELHIMTLLEGERKVKEPIHNADFFKEMLPENLLTVIERFSKLLSPFV